MSQKGVSFPLLALRSLGFPLGCLLSSHKAVKLCQSHLSKDCWGATGNFTETELGEVKFPEIPAPILEKVCQYFYYKLRYQNECAHPPNLLRGQPAPRQGCDVLCGTAGARRSSKSIPEFPMPPEIALELLKAANYLDT